MSIDEETVLTEKARNGMDKNLTKTEMRQGVTGHNVRYVLAISLILAVIGLGAIGFFMSPAGQ